MKLENLQPAKVLSHVRADDFVGRSDEMQKILGYAQSDNEVGDGLLLLSAPAVGATEFLRQTFDRFFNEQNETIPFYFSLKLTDKTVKNSAARFLQSFLTQTVAFRRKDMTLLAASPEISEIVNLASDSPDNNWIKTLVSQHTPESRFDTEQSFVRNCLSAPLRAFSSGNPVFMLIDDFHQAAHLTGETDLVDELKEIYSHSNIRFVFAGRRRFVLKASQIGNAKLSNAEILRLKELSFPEAGVLTVKLADKYAVKINVQTRDLIVRQFAANPLLIESLFIAARRAKRNLDSFQKVQQIYTDELFGGAIGKYYDHQFNEIISNSITRARFFNILQKTFIVENKKAGVGVWRKNLKIPDEEFFRILQRLHVEEIINFDSNKIQVSDENTCLQDYIETRYRLEVLNEQRAQTVSSFLAKSLERASQLMMRSYRRESALNLRELLAAFNGQTAPKVLLDYAIFKEKYKGIKEAEILEQLKNTDEKIELPSVVFTASGASVYPALGKITEEERIAVGLAYEKKDFRKENEIAWIIAEIDSKMEAPPELAEFWCDRLEMAALICNFAQYQLCLISPEGFSPDALDVLRQQKAIGISRAQFKLLAKYLSADNAIPTTPNQNVFEMVVPMGEDTEIIAARTIEEIARRHNFNPKAITQIKTALVEACINATEHSLSPDRKIYQKFTVEDDKLVITISNRGVKIPTEKVAQMTERIESENGRRGWGLKLMQTLMDEVKFEQVDDGTRISMVKYLNGKKR